MPRTSIEVELVSRCPSAYHRRRRRGVKSCIKADATFALRGSEREEEKIDMCDMLRWMDAYEGHDRHYLSGMGRWFPNQMGPIIIIIVLEGINVLNK